MFLLAFLFVKRLNIVDYCWFFYIICTYKITKIKNTNKYFTTFSKLCKNYLMNKYPIYFLLSMFCEILIQAFHNLLVKLSSQFLQILPFWRFILILLRIFYDVIVNLLFKFVSIFNSGELR